MGNQDNWTTPKQIKIEREGEPRGTRRGPLKKGDRRKGIKARIDELKSSRRTLQTYAGWMMEKQSRIGYRFNWERHFDEQQKKHEKLLNAALRDNVIEIVDGWEVEKP